jgi:hypothetical protein
LGTLEDYFLKKLACIFFQHVPYSFNFVQKNIAELSLYIDWIQLLIPPSHLPLVQVLEKVKHENIVKLLAIEEEQEGRGKVRP